VTTKEDPGLYEVTAPSDDEAPDAPNWRGGLEYGEKGPRPIIGNAIHALTCSLEWRGVIAFNAFDGSVVKLREPPMRNTERPEGYAIGEWNDIDTSLLTAWLSRHADVRVNPQIAGRAVYAVAQQKAFHPVRDYLKSLRWDGKVRLFQMLERYFGAAATELHEAIGSRWMTSAVARVMIPGCKADHAIVLEGEQGVGKSTAIEVLASAPFYSDTPIVFGEKDSYEALRGVWLYELAELSAMRKSDLESQKAFLSKRVDRYRRPYAEGPTQWPRQCVFAGTTNDQHYLMDPTGNRRFWPVRCGSIDIAALTADRDQLWAEALVRFEGGEKWHLDTPELTGMAREAQAERVHSDDWETIVARWLQTEKALYLLNQGNGISAAEVLQNALNLRAADIDRQSSTRVGIVLRALGWAKRRVMVDGRREWRMFAPELPPTEQSA
jgi:putative DNA primase/helicase